jgi:hypothetical protein
MYYRGDCSNYAAGDYYQGDYYRGDPGLFSAIGKAFKGVTGFVSKLGIPGVSQVAGIAHGIASGGRLAVQPAITPSFFPTGGPLGQSPMGLGGFPEYQQPVGTMLPGGFVQMCGIKGTRPNKSSYYRRIPGTLQGQLIPKGSVCVKTRRMNVANARAIRRSVRRLSGFAKLARRTLRFVQAKPVKGKAVFKKKR